MFDISLLRCFVTVAEEMHFGRAAERMNMSQPPFSRQIQILERTLGVQLLERTSRSVKLTPAGQNFLPEARQILQLLENATVIAKRISLGKSGSLKIGFTAMAAIGSLPLLVAAFQEYFPDAKLILQEAGSAEQIRKLNASELDVAIVRPPVPAALRSMPIATEPLVVAVPAAHALAKKSTIRLQDLSGEPFISYLPYEAYYLCTMVGDLLAKAGVAPNYVQQLTQVHSVMALVHAGIGVSLVPESARLFNFSDVVLRKIEDSQPRPLELFMVWRADNLNPLIQQATTIVAKIASTARNK